MATFMVNGSLSIEGFDLAMDVPVVDHVVVVENQDDRFIAIAQLVDQERQHVLGDRRAGAVQCRFGVGAEGRVDPS